MTKQLCQCIRNEADFHTATLRCILFISGALLAQSSSALAGSPAEFMEINAEIEIVSWFGELDGTAGPDSQRVQVHAVVGKDRWVLGRLSSGQTNYCAFDGTNIVEWGCSFGTNGYTGSRWTRVSEPFSLKSPDGNPDESVRMSDDLGLAGRIAWLAFCSPATLSNPNHKLYPNWGFWREYLNPSALTEKVDRFKDGLALPKFVLIFSGENQPVVDYRVSGFSNVAGISFPQSFYLREYAPFLKGWELQVFAQGRISSVKRVGNPFLPDIGRYFPPEQSAPERSRFTVAASGTFPSPPQR